MAKRKKSKNKSKKKIGEYGETVISEFANAAKALKHRYMMDFPDLILYMHFNALGKNFVFQRVRSFPLQKISYWSETHSIKFDALWTSDGALNYLLPKSFFEPELKKSAEPIGWGDVSYFNPGIRYAGKLNRGGEFIHLEEADEIDAEMDIKIDNIKSINMHDWGFELIGTIISLLAVNKKAEFNEVNLPNLHYKVSLDTDSLSFKLNNIFKNNKLEVRWSQPGYEPIKQKSPDFNRLLFDEIEEEKPEVEVKVKNIGQRSMDNLILDYED